MEADHRIAELLSLLEQAEGLFRRQEQPHWADWLRRDHTRIADGRSRRQALKQGSRDRWASRVGRPRCHGLFGSQK